MLRPRKRTAEAPVSAIAHERCLAKTHWTPHGPVAGRTVEEHCRIAGAVAQGLLARLFSAWPAGKKIFPANASLAPRLHDIGKVCPSFQKKLHDAIGDAGNWPELTGVDATLERQWGKHAAVSFAALKAAGAPERLAWCVGLHHGDYFIPQAHDCGHFGASPWAAQRLQLIRDLVADQAWPEIRNLTEALLIRGLTVVSDWIASGDIFSDPAAEWEPLVEKSLDQAGFTFPLPGEEKSFEELFGFAPNSCQLALAEAVTGPGIYILEAPMGIGKTEAALYAASRLLARRLASGIYFALPTQLSSNKLHERVESFLERLLGPGAPVLLAHADAWLARRQRQIMGAEADAGGQWFEQGRRAILAPYAVGTVDQALMAALRVPWAGLRLFGLAGKVVILDEIHSYDAYTGALLDALSAHLAALGCTVIILSATLTNARRSTLLQGAGGECLPLDASYPRLSVARAGGETLARPLQAAQDANVAVRLGDYEEEALDEILERAAAGQQTIWLENTVRMAQDVFRRLAARASGLGIETGLLHSRFTARDRADNEARWTALLGARGHHENSRRSDCGRILVGTQVIEQSLDLDADFMVSRFAPTDLILQRLGRLWRHSRPDRCPGARREAWLLAPRLEEALTAPIKAFEGSGSSLVYSPYTLARSLKVWQNRTTIALPSEIRQLIEASHLAQEEAAGSPMARALEQEKRDLAQKKGLALQGLADIGKMLDEDVAGTRLIEQETVRVLLLRDLDAAGAVCRLTSGELVQLGGRPGGSERRDRGAALALQMVKVPEYGSPPVPDRTVQKLFEPYCHEARCEKLRVLLLNEAGRASDASGRVLDDVSYSPRIGYFCRE